MCGFVGIVNGNDEDRSDFDLMLSSIRHRGPDDSSFYIDEDSGVFLGSRRLSILDLSENGRMPMFNEGRTVVVCQNGEIYNYPKLKNTLQEKGHKFLSGSDTEVIVHGYEEWGNDVFTKLQGMFAIVIYNLHKKKIILARDRVGIKPLYYLKHGNRIYFSSEAKSFNCIHDFSFRNNLDYENVDNLLGFMFLPKSGETIIKGVKKLLPGHYLEIDVCDQELTETKYWELPTQFGKTPSFDEAVEELNELLVKTVKSHLMSDVPLGVLLSGGLDSSLLTALVKKVTDSPVITFTAKFNHKFNESVYATEVADFLETKHEEIFIDASSINKNIEKYIRDFDDLTTFDGGLLTTKILCEEIKKKGVTVLLLGEGADEIFGGYSWFGLSQAPLSMLPRKLQACLYYYALSRNITYKPGEYYKYWIDMYDKNFTHDTFRNISSVELRIQLPNHLLMKVDKASMASSVEARVPYLDHKLVEYVYGLPQEYKLKGALYSSSAVNEKHILRRVASKYLPVAMISRKKRGFMMPMDDVLKADYDKVKDYVYAKDSIARNVMSQQAIEGLFEKSRFGLLNMQREYLLWRLFLLEVWGKEYGR